MFAAFVEATGYPTGAEQYGSSAVFHLLAKAPKEDVLGPAAGARSPKVQTLLASLAAGTTPLTHKGLDTHIPTAGRAVDHLRALLVHHGLLPYRDPYLARFEAWIEDKLRTLAPEVARPVEHFARWHHLRRIRSTATPESPARGPVHSAKQDPAAGRPVGIRGCRCGGTWPGAARSGH